jgi:hypothetical protein
MTGIFTPAYSVSKRTGSDGHDTFHVTVNANGEVTVEFDKLNCF